ncbi:MAG TPA: hypothetical protein VNV61_17500 [Steroidobacteraceae bacterium]|jgi:hypothetical protein|nr:hypothetical protein [Steroidobacteraceae bacterium]
MNRLLTVVATTGAICVVSQALAADSDNQSTMSERQLIAQIVGCMRARMSANKDSSYKDAYKACKNQVIKGGDSPPDAVAVSGTQAKP